VLAAAQLAFDAHMHALLEGGGVLPKLAPDLDSVLFGPRLALSALYMVPSRYEI
jgi:hypothetical protein